MFKSKIRRIFPSDFFNYYYKFFTLKSSTLTAKFASDIIHMNQDR